MGIFIENLNEPQNCWSCGFRCKGYCIADNQHRYIGQGDEIPDKSMRKEWCPVKTNCIDEAKEEIV